VPLAEMTALISSSTDYRHLILTEQMKARVTTAQERRENGMMPRKKRERRLRSRALIRGGERDTGSIFKAHVTCR